MDRAAANDGFSIRFSAREWSEAELRSAVWELYARTIWQDEFEPLPDGPLHVEARFRTLPGLRLADVTSSSTLRARRMAKRLDDEVTLNISLAGSRMLSQRGRKVVVGDGEAVLTSGAEVSATMISPSHFITVGLPAKAIAPLVPDFNDRVARPIRRGAALGLLASYADVLQGTEGMAPDARRLAVTHVYDLVALALGAAGDRAEAASLRGARAARLAAIKADIREHLGSAISVAGIAARHRLPVRYLQRLFEDEGITFTEFVFSERLRRAHRMLSDPRLATRPIGTIAFDVGFCNVSHFSRVFRQRFGTSPSDVRATTRGGPDPRG